MGTVTVGPHQNERCSDDCIVIVVFSWLSRLKLYTLWFYSGTLAICVFFIVYMCFWFEQKMNNYFAIVWKC